MSNNKAIEVAEEAILKASQAKLKLFSPPTPKCPVCGNYTTAGTRLDHKGIADAGGKTSREQPVLICTTCHAIFDIVTDDILPD